MNIAKEEHVLELEIFNGGIQSLQQVKKRLTRGEKKSNFISYVRSSNKIFKDEKNISNIEKNHMRKIAKVIKQKRIKYSKKDL